MGILWFVEFNVILVREYIKLDFRFCKYRIYFFDYMYIVKEFKLVIS